MSLSIIWKSGDDSVEILGGDVHIGFFGDNFGESVPLDNYQNTSVATNGIGTVNDGALPNVKYVDMTQGKWGNAIQNIVDLSDEDATLHIRLTSGSASRLQAINLYAYSGSFSAGMAPVDMNVMGFEVGGVNTSWTHMSGSAAPLALTPHIVTAQQNHDYYIAISASPKITGINTAVSLAIYAEWY